MKLDHCAITQFCPTPEHYISVQFITICTVVKSKCAIEKCNVCAKKCRDSAQYDDLCADYRVLCSC